MERRKKKIKRKVKGIMNISPLIHITQPREAILPNVFLKRIQQNPLHQQSYSRSCHSRSRGPAKRTRTISFHANCFEHPNYDPVNS
jgi:hypothetical protein